MFSSLLGSTPKFCDGASRRNFLKIGAFGAGLTLAEGLRLQAATKAAKQDVRTSKMKSAIFIYLPGGPSHMDMYDLKPDAPAEYRGEFNPIKTNVEGVEICEHFPMQAKMWDKLSVIRSIVSTDEHSDSSTHTGFPERINRIQQHPSFGSVVSKLRGSEAGAVPPFVSLRGMSMGTEPGFLGVAHRPFTPSGAGKSNLKLASNVTVDRLDDRKQLLGSFDDIRRDIDSTGSMVGMDSYSERALEMVTGGVARKALDLKNEDAKTLERYKGLESFLTARRLVEAGVGFVTLSYGGWDTHGSNFTSLKKQLPNVDRAIANLIQDLHDRGLQDDVVTVMWGEFGRTPKINSGAGRDHWSPVMSAMIAGGGLKMGQAVGSSTAKGERPKDRPYTVSQVMSTIYHTVGIDPSQTFLNGSGRPMYILEDREPVRELL